MTTVVFKRDLMENMKLHKVPGRRQMLGRQAVLQFSSVQFSLSVVSNSLRPHELQHARPPPVVMYGCESWTVKKAERQRIDAFELWYWRRLLRVP